MSDARLLPIDCKKRKDDGPNCPGECHYTETIESGDDPPRPVELWTCDTCDNVRRFKPPSADAE